MIEPIRLELPTFENLSVNAWLFKGEENILIDCGERSDASWSALVSQLALHDLKISDISKVIITHAHYDHIGMAQRITEESDATIWISEMVLAWAVNLEMMLERRAAAIQTIFQRYIEKEELSNFDEFSNKIILEFWQEIPKDRLHVFPMTGKIDINGLDWDVIYTPGHCLNQTCFYEQNSGWLLSADMLLPMIPLPIIDASREAPYEGVKSLLMHYESYDILSKIKITKVFPGHMAAFENANEMIDKQKNRIIQKKEKCFKLIEDGMNNFMDLIYSIYPNKISIATVLMVVGFIEILDEEGKITVRLKNDKPSIESIKT